MGQWIVTLIVNWLHTEIQNGSVADLAKKINDVAIPWVRARADEVFEKLKAEAAKTGTPIDDALAEVIEELIDALIPRI